VLASPCIVNHVNLAAKVFLVNFKIERPLPLLVPRLFPPPPNTFTAVFFNCRSLQSHHSLITSDNNLMAADIFFLAETRLPQFALPSRQLTRIFPYYTTSGVGTRATIMLSKREPLFTAVSTDPLFSGVLLITPSASDGAIVVIGLYVFPHHISHVRNSCQN